MILSSGRKLLLVVIIITGCVGLIGNAVVSITFIDPFATWGPYMYSALFRDTSHASKGIDLQWASILGCAIPLSFGLLTIIFWFIGKPSSTFKFVNVFRFLAVLSCILAFAGTCISHALILHPYPIDYVEKWQPDQKKFQDFLTWLQLKFSYDQDFIDYAKNLLNNMNKLPFHYSIFLCFSAIFCSLSLVY